MNKNTYSIGDTARLTHATQKQIRNWEARGYIPLAGRVVSGDRAYRRFSIEQVEIISCIKTFLDEGFTLSAAVEKVKESLVEYKPLDNMLDGIVNMDKIDENVPNMWSNFEKHFNEAVCPFCYSHEFMILVMLRKMTPMTPIEKVYAHTCLNCSNSWLVRCDPESNVMKATEIDEDEFILLLGVHD